MAESRFQITDYSDEKSSFGVTSVALTAANIVAQTTAAGNLAGAVEGLSIGSLTKQTISQVLLDAPAIPSNPYAQREMKWLVTYAQVSNGKQFQVEIAAPDITDNVIPNTDVADITSTDWVAFKGAFEAFARSPDDSTEAVALIRAELVGRNI